MKFSLSFIALVACITGPALAVDLEPRAEAAPACGNPNYSSQLFRSYNPSIIDHFYTTNNAEMRNAVSMLGYNFEGSVGRIFSYRASDTVPFYRMWSPGATDHFYTTSRAERDNAANNLGYNNEGVVGYVYRNAGCGGIPLYRMYSPSGTDHFYTTSQSERDNAVDNLGYNDEGIAAYVLPNSMDGDSDSDSD